MGKDDILLVLPALAARQGRDGGFVLTHKFVDGVVEYVRRWPGRVRVAVDREERPGTNLDEVQVNATALPFDLIWREAADQMRQVVAGASVVLASLVDKNVGLPAICSAAGAALMYISEYSVLTRRQIIRAETTNPILRWRRELWTNQLEKRYCRAVAGAAGIQCNGTPTFDAYRSISPSPLLYFDTRVRAAELVGAETLERRIDVLRRGNPIRLAFSGRLIAMKGADHLPRVGAELQRLGVPFTMEVCGGGDQEATLTQEIARLGLKDHLRLRGVLDFQKELMPLVRSEVDLFVCCHRQGDPSCTYLETMSCGTPIAGYNNDAFTGIVQRSGSGWLTPLDRPELLAAKIAELARHRDALARAAHAALAFARLHTFEQTMQSRIDHMITCGARSAVEAGT